MTFTQAQLRDRLSTAGIPAWGFQLVDDTYETVAPGYLARVWQAWVESLRLNAPDVLFIREIGGGKTRLVPKWVAQAGDCDNHALLCYAHEQTGNWINAVHGGSLVGRACGILFFTSEPRAENLDRVGRHCLMWHLDHAGQFATFEPGDGNYGALTPTEAASVTFGLSA